MTNIDTAAATITPGVGNGVLSNEAALAARQKQSLKTVRDLAKSSAAGNDSIPAFAILVFEDGHDGVIVVKGKKGEADGITQYYDLYRKVESDSRVQVFETTAEKEKNAKSKAAQYSKLRAIGKCSQKPGISRDWLANVANLRAAQDAAGEPVRGPYDAFVEACKAQVKSDAMLTEDQLRKVMLKKEKMSKSVAQRLAAIIKSLEKLITEENVTNVDVIEGHTKLKSALDNDNAAETQEEEVNEAVEALQALGFKIKAPRKIPVPARLKN